MPSSTLTDAIAKDLARLLVAIFTAANVAVMVLGILYGPPLAVAIAATFLTAAGVVTVAGIVHPRLTLRLFA